MGSDLTPCTCTNRFYRHPVTLLSTTLRTPNPSCPIHVPDKQDD
jgi:hypothetical protein